MLFRSAGATPSPFRTAGLSKDNSGGTITKSVGGILRPLCAHRVRNVVHRHSPSKADRHSVAVAWDGRLVTRSLFGRQSEVAGVRCWHHDVSAVTHSEGADATGERSGVKPKTHRPSLRGTAATDK